MKEKVINFDELTDSREMLRAREPNFIVIFIYFILILIFVSFLWMWFGEIDIVVKANGIVRPGKTISVIYNATGGEVKQINFKNGKMVKSGRLLYSLDTSFLDMKKNTLLKRIDKIKKDKKLLYRLEKSIKEGKNYLSKQKLIFYNRYLVFKTRYEQLQLDYKMAKKKYSREKNLGPNFTTESKLEELKTKLDYANLNKGKYYYQTVVNIKNEIDNKKEILSQLKQQLADTDDKIKLSQVEAPITGTVQTLHKFNNGDYLSAGIKVLKIIPETKADLKMDITVKNKDISNLEKGQEVKYRILSLPYKEYGILKGELSKISSDASLSQKEGKLPYNIEATVDKIKLHNKKGEVEYIKSGMLCEARVIVRQKKILYYILEKLDFIS